MRVFFVKGWGGEDHKGHLKSCIDAIEPHMKNADDVIGRIKHAEADLVPRATMTLAHHNTTCYQKIRNYKGAVDGIDLAINTIPGKLSRAERAATVREYSP